MVSNQRQPKLSFFAAPQQKYLVELLWGGLCHDIIACKFFFVSLSGTLQCNNMLCKREGGWGRGFNLSNDVIACCQWTLLAVQSPSHCSAAHHPVWFYGCILQCGIGLHCDNLCFAGGDIKYLSDDIIACCQLMPHHLHCSVANQTSLCSAAMVCCNMASVCKLLEQGSRT